MERSPSARIGTIRLVLLAAALAAAGCSSTDAGPTPTAVKAIGPTSRLAVGGTFQLSANVEAGTTTLTAAKVSWVSRDTTTASVDASGLVKALRAGESWIIGTSGPAKDSALVEVVYAAASRAGALRMRTGKIDQQLTYTGESQVEGLATDFLGVTQEDYWEFVAVSNTQDTALIVFLPDDPTGAKQTLANLTATQIDALTLADLTTPVAFLDIYAQGVERLVPLTGYVEGGIDQSIPLSLRLGLTHLRLVASGPSWLGVGAGYAYSGEIYSVVADLRPAYLHIPQGTSAGSMTGTQPDHAWTLRDADWTPSASQGRSYLLGVNGNPTVLAYMPGIASADLGGSAETTKGYLTLRDSTGAYNATATSGKVTVAQYTAPPAADVFGEIRGSVTASGTGSLGSAAATPFSTSFSFDAAVPPTAITGAPRSAGLADALRQWAPALVAAAVRRHSPARPR